MLRPAQEYAQLLQEENVKAWYKPENMYWNGGAGDDDISLPDNNYEKHCFVSVNSEDDILGYISYIPDWDAMSVSDVCIISYRKKSVEFAKDVYTAVCNIFEVYNMNRMEWHCYADNPVIRGYRKFIKRYGGRECGYRRQVVKLQDGKLHDIVEFEILRDEFYKKGNGQLISNDLISRSALERTIKEMENESKAEYCEHGRDDPFIEGGLSAISSVFKIISNQTPFMT